MVLTSKISKGQPPDLGVMFKRKESRNIFKEKFLVINFKLIYNCIIGKPTLDALLEFLSLVYLKMKYHREDNTVALIKTNIEV